MTGTRSRRPSIRNYLDDNDDSDDEYKVVVWDVEEISTSTFFRGALAFDRASDHFSEAQNHPQASEAWFLRKQGDGWQIVAPPCERDSDSE